MLLDIVPIVLSNGLQNVKTEVVQPVNCHMINKTTIPAVPVSVLTDCTAIQLM